MVDPVMHGHCTMVARTLVIDAPANIYYFLPTAESMTIAAGYIVNKKLIRLKIKLFTLYTFWQLPKTVLQGIHPVSKMA